MADTLANCASNNVVQYAVAVQETASLGSGRSQPRRRSQSQTQPQQLQQQASQRPRPLRRTLTRMETFMPGRSQPSRWKQQFHLCVCV